MANNQYVNKVVYGNQTLIDLTSDTIGSDKILSGYTAHDKSGASITGNIPTKDTTNIILRWFDGEQYELMDSGYYPISMMIPRSAVLMQVPSSGINKFTVYIPNGTLTPSSSDPDDWIPLVIEVDSNGNSNVTDDTIPATGVSF